MRLCFSHALSCALVLGTVLAAPVEATPGSKKWTLQGRVEGPDGKPVSGARVRTGFDEVDDTGSEPWHSAKTGPDGAFRLEGLDRRKVHLMVRATGFLDWNGEASASDSALKVSLDPGATLSGQVVAEGEPVERVRVRVHRRVTSADEPYSQGETEASADGRFSISGLLPGTYQVMAEGKTLTFTRRAESTVVVGDHGSASVELRVGVGLELSGTVVDQAGAPVAGARVEAVAVPVLEASYFYRCGSVVGYGDFRTETGPDGRFRLRFLGVGRYQVTAQVPGLVRAASLFETGQNDARLVLLPEGHIRGRVVDQAGRPLKAFSIGDQHFSGPDGRFALSMDAPRRLELVFSAKDREHRSVVVEGRPGEERDLGDVVLGPGRTLRGVVRDEATGRPLPGVGVVAVEAGTYRLHDRGIVLEAGWVKLAAATTDRQGAYRLEHLPQSGVELRVGTGETYIAVPLPDGATGFDPRMAALGSIRGSVSGAGGPGASDRVLAVALEGGRVLSGELKDGAFSIEGVPAGRYQVRALWHHHAVVMSSEVTLAEVRAGEAARLDLREADSGAEVGAKLEDAFSGEAQERRACLFPGDVPTPTSPEGVLRSCAAALYRGAYAGRSSGLGFGRVPAGHYTLFYVRRGDWETEARVRLVRVPVDVPETGVVIAQVVMDRSVVPLEVPGIVETWGDED